MKVRRTLFKQLVFGIVLMLAVALAPQVAGAATIVDPTDEEYSLSGFIAWMLERDDLTDEQQADLENAQAMLEEYIDAGYIDVDDDDDAVNLDNVLLALDIIDDLSDDVVNDTSLSGYSAFLTNFTMLVGSAYTCDVSVTSYAHVSDFGTFSTTEGLAWGYADPTIGWVDSEKAVFDAYKVAAGYEEDEELSYEEFFAVRSAATADGAVVGHYANLFYCGTEQLIGVGYSTAYNLYGSITASYNTTALSQYASYASYSTDEIRVLIEEYEAEMVVTIYRLYNKSTGEHLYTRSTTEVEKCVAAGWVDEGIGWYAPLSGTAVYRLYNPNNGEHLYTTSETEVEKCVALGWEDEGLNLYSAEDGDVAVYRLFNPNETVGTHLFTTSSTEVTKCTTAGWEYEGVCLYGVSVETDEAEDSDETEDAEEAEETEDAEA